jgi:hypothetical protein
VFPFYARAAKGAHDFHKICSMEKSVQSWHRRLLFCHHLIIASHRSPAAMGGSRGVELDQTKSPTFEFSRTRFTGA